MANKDAIGDFSPDGKRIAVAARDSDGKVISGVEWADVTKQEAQLYDLRKGGYHLIAAQQATGVVQTTQTAIEVDLGIVQPLLGQNVNTTFIADAFDNLNSGATIDISPNVKSSNGDVITRGFERGAINELVCFISVPAFTSQGAVLTDPATDQPWLAFLVETSSAARRNFAVVVSPRVDSYRYAMNEKEAFDPTTANEDPVRHYDEKAGAFSIARESLLRWYEWSREGNFYIFRMAFFPWFSGEAVKITLAPTWMEESEIPTATIDTVTEVISTQGNPKVTGARLFSQFVIASGTAFPAYLTLAQDVRNLSDAVRVIDVKTKEDILNLKFFDDHLQASQDLLTKWLQTLSDLPTNSAYDTVAEIPDDVDVALVKKEFGAGVYVRSIPIAPATLGKMQELSQFSVGSMLQKEAYKKAVTFVAGLRAAAGAPVDPAEIAQIEADLQKLENDLLNFSKTAGVEVSEVATYVTPEPIWPAGLAASSSGSLMVRKGEVANVKTTMVNNNSFAGSHVIGQTFTAAERGKAVVARAAVKASDLSARIELSAQTFPDGGSLAQATLAYANGAWTATGGTVTLDEGWAVLDFPVTFSPNANSQIIGGISAGDVQLLALYDAAKAAYTKTRTGMRITDLSVGSSLDIPITIAADVETNRKAIATNLSTILSNAARIASVEAKVDATTPIKMPGGDARSDATPFITIPDRAGVRFEKLKFTFRDSRKNAAGGWDYASRAMALEVPAAWLDMGAVTGRTGWTAVAQTFEDPTSTATPKATTTRNSLFRTLSFGTANAKSDYDVWLNFRRNADSWDIWFQGQHITTDRKPLNQYCGAYEIVAEYVVDTNAVDPKLKPITDRLTKLEAKPDPDLSGLATTAQLSAEITRAKKAEGDNALAIATNSASIGVVSSNLAAEVARAKAAEAALSGTRSGASAKKQGRTKLWSPEASDFTVTLGSLIEDTAPAFAGSADIEAKAFTVVPAAPGVRPATVKFTATGLVVGQRYELVVEVGSGLVTNFTLAGPPATSQDVTNWKKFSQIITATATTYAGSYTVTHGAVVHGPAVYSLPGLYVQDEQLQSYQVAEPADVAAAEARSLAVTNFLGQTVQGQGSRISALEAKPSGTSPPDPQWFPAERDYDKTYNRRTKSGKQMQTISFDFVAAGTTSVPMSVNLPAANAPVSGWPISQFWGIPTLFINITPPGGSAMIVTVGASTDGYVEIGVGAATGAPSASIGRVRNVVIDGIPADRVS